MGFFQLEKVYDPKNEEDDMMEMEEERLRMREHVMRNVRHPPSLPPLPSPSDFLSIHLSVCVSI